MRRIITALVTTALSVSGTAAVAQATASATRTAPTVQTASLTRVDEDSPRFDCRKHGNRTCGTAFDPRPNNGKRETVRVNLVFNKAGDLVRAYTW